MVLERVEGKKGMEVSEGWDKAGRLSIGLGNVRDVSRLGREAIERLGLKIEERHHVW